MKRIYIKEYAGEEWFWKLLCLVFDNEALGLLERLLEQTKLEYKVEKVQFNTIGERI